jgi:hypothetical protein
MTPDQDDCLITPEQAIAARDLLNQTPMEIARNLAVTHETIVHAVGRRRQRPLVLHPRLAKRLRAYFEAHGVEFLADGQVQMKQATKELPK